MFAAAKLSPANNLHQIDWPPMWVVRWVAELTTWSKSRYSSQNRVLQLSYEFSR